MDTHQLVNLNAQRARSHVPDAAGLSMVHFVGHALVHRAVHNHVDIVAHLRRDQLRLPADSG